MSRGDVAESIAMVVFAMAVGVVLGTLAAG